MLCLVKIIILLICSHLIFTINAVEECDNSKTPKCSNLNYENKYSEGANTKYSLYLNQIREAEELHIPCDNTKCGCYSSVINNDLIPFKGGITKAEIENVRQKGTKYQIIKHRLYKDKNCMFPARCAGIEHFLLNLVDTLPDMELIINPRDWPQVYKNYGAFGPIFSFSKTSDYADIMYPAWSFWEGGPAINLYPTGIGRWDKHRLELGKEGNNTIWENKISKGFFRGSRTSSERDPLVLLSRDNPDMVDAQYTKNQAWKSDADTLHSPPAQEVSFKEHCKYKYLFNFRGVAASFRFKHILLCKSLVFHVGDEWLEFFYPALKPWIHYIPVEANASKEKIKEILEFVEHHDDVAKKIAENGYNMIWNNLKMKDISCYWRRLLKRYSKLLKFKVELDLDLIEVKK